jgi:hypothetical protein
LYSFGPSFDPELFDTERAQEALLLALSAVFCQVLLGNRQWQWQLKRSTRYKIQKARYKQVVSIFFPNENQHTNFVYRGKQINQFRSPRFKMTYGYGEGSPKTPLKRFCKHPVSLSRFLQLFPPPLFLVVLRQWKF